MAVRTTQLALIQDLNGGELRAEIDWEDDLATIDPDSGEKHADTGDLLEFRAINTAQKPGRLVIRRPGVREPWMTVAVPPNSNRTILPTGFVKQITDANVGLGMSR